MTQSLCRQFDCSSQMMLCSEAVAVPGFTLVLADMRFAPEPHWVRAVNISSAADGFCMNELSAEELSSLESRSSSFVFVCTSCFICVSAHIRLFCAAQPSCLRHFLSWSQQRQNSQPQFHFSMMSINFPRMSLRKHVRPAVQKTTGFLAAWTRTGICDFHDQFFHNHFWSESLTQSFQVWMLMSVEIGKCEWHHEWMTSSCFSGAKFSRGSLSWTQYQSHHMSRGLWCFPL